MAYKLDDGGTTLKTIADGPLRWRGADEAGQAHLRATAPGTAPNDWYILYLNDDNQLIASAYIVTYGKSAEEANAEPHAILYEDFMAVPGPDGRDVGLAEPDVDLLQLDRCRRPHR